MYAGSELDTVIVHHHKRRHIIGTPGASDTEDPASDDTPSIVGFILDVVDDFLS